MRTWIGKQRSVVPLAYKILSTFGPDSENIIERSTGLVIASQSVIAHDLLSLAWGLLGRPETPSTEFIWFENPNNCQFSTNMTNLPIVSKLAEFLMLLRLKWLREKISTQYVTIEPRVAFSSFLQVDPRSTLRRQMTLFLRS